MKMTTSASKSGENTTGLAISQRIQERAYYLWLEGGCQHGDHENHWSQAEREVLELLKSEHKPQSGGREKKRS